ncbi:MAG TPA: hypothetical protein VF704_06160 [Allosphingosinicella sp.]|jgi:hypothetical protein
MGRSDDVHVVTDPAVAALLGQTLQRRLLLAFAASERPIAPVARQLGQPIANVHYHVTRMARLGLLIVAREEKRRGRPVKHYRTVRPRFFLPDELIGRTPGDGLAAELRARLEEEALKADGGGGILFSVDCGRPRMERIAGEPRPRAAAELWEVFAMTDAEAAILAQDMETLFRRHREQCSGKGRPFLCHAAFAPRK